MRNGIFLAIITNGAEMSKTILFRDEFTIHQVSDSLADFREALKERDELVIDLLAIKRMDVAAVQVLLAVRNECQRTGHGILIRKPASLAHYFSLIGDPL